VRLRYTKRGKVRWISHRDVARVLERAFRVAQLPLAFTEGFSPRPKVSFGLALSTGHESDGEYLDMVLARDLDVDELPASLSDALPEGMAVTGAAVLVDRAPALQEAVTAVDWHVELAPETDIDLVARAITTGLAAGELPAERRRKGRTVTEDIRPVIRCVEISATAPTVLSMELHTQPRSAKPGEVLEAIACAVGAPGALVERRALRTHQWIERDGARCEPLDADTRPRVPEACVT
jgi:radical SAM-linked protein